jgi:hypothetical protein
MKPLRVWLNPEHGRALLGLGYELCWATTWMSDANTWIGPVLGLPELPFVEFGDALLAERPDGIHHMVEITDGQTVRMTHPIEDLVIAEA